MSWFPQEVNVGACNMQQPIRIGQIQVKPGLLEGFTDMSRDEMVKRGAFAAGGGIAGYLLAKSVPATLIGVALGLVLPPLIGRGWE
jgi:hypothetical protein